jgi:spermidine/putrescine transport system permease protein
MSATRLSSTAVQRWLLRFYLVVFFGFLFGPLVIIAIAAFNDSAFPQATPFEGFTTRWFSALADDDQLLEGLVNSLWIGVGVVLLSVPIGLAAALLMSNLRGRTQSLLYAVVISPTLIPGVVLGISTLLFWEGMISNGIVLTIIGQATFISAYVMLVFLARLQRYDRTLEEAARDLGATPARVFRSIFLPTMRPAIVTASVLAFLCSFENYNTTVFTIQTEATLTTVLAGRVRMGSDPSLAALALVIIAVTVVGSVLAEWLRRGETVVAVPARNAAADSR